MRRTTAGLGATALLALVIGAVTSGSWAVPWTPQPPWPTRAAQTAVARTATSSARTATAAAWPTLVPTRTPTVTRTPMPTGPALTIPPPTSIPPQPDGETPVPVSSYAPRPLLTPPALDPLVGAWQPLDPEEAAYLAALNQQRASLGLPLVQPDPTLMAAAQWHASDMARVGYLSHRDSLGRDSGWRMNVFGSSPYVARCNIAQGRAEPTFGGADAWLVWDLSSSHRLCQTDPRYTLIGIGRAWGSIDGWRWSVDFSAPVGASWPTATPLPQTPYP